MAKPNYEFEKRKRELEKKKKKEEKHLKKISQEKEEKQPDPLLESALPWVRTHITNAGSTPLRGRTAKPLRGLAAAAASVEVVEKLLKTAFFC